MEINLDDVETNLIGTRGTCNNFGTQIQISDIVWEEAVRGNWTKEALAQGICEALRDQMPGLVRQFICGVPYEVKFKARWSTNSPNAIHAPIFQLWFRSLIGYSPLKVAYQQRTAPVLNTTANAQFGLSEMIKLSPESYLANRFLTRVHSVKFHGASFLSELFSDAGERLAPISTVIDSFDSPASVFNSMLLTKPVFGMSQRLDSGLHLLCGGGRFTLAQPLVNPASCLIQRYLFNMLVALVRFYFRASYSSIMQGYSIGLTLAFYPVTQEFKYANEDGIITFLFGYFNWFNLVEPSQLRASDYVNFLVTQKPNLGMTLEKDLMASPVFSAIGMFPSLSWLGTKSPPLDYLLRSRTEEERTQIRLAHTMGAGFIAQPRPHVQPKVVTMESFREFLRNLNS